MRPAQHLFPFGHAEDGCRIRSRSAPQELPLSPEFLFGFDERRSQAPARWTTGKLLQIRQKLQSLRHGIGPWVSFRLGTLPAPGGDRIGSERRG